MEVQLRPSRARLHPLVLPASRRRGIVGFGSLGADTTCQWPQPGVPQVYPACTGTPDQPMQQSPYDRDVYAATDVPGLILPAPSNCIDSTGNVIMNDSCVKANEAVQQQNFQRIARYNSDPAFAASFWGSSPAPNLSANSSAGSNPLNQLVTARVSFSNLTRPGQTSTLQVGDQWSIAISGAPNTPVYVTGGMGGGSATNQMGSTDGNGNRTITGTMTADQIGNWSESWFVGQQPAGSFSFSVVAKPQAPPPSGGSGQQQQQQSGNHQTGGGSQQQQQTSDQITGFIGKLFSDDGMGIPTWALIAGGLAVAYFMFGGKR